MKKLKELISNKRGSSLVEVLVATGVFVIAASGIMAIMISSVKVSDTNAEMRRRHETAVGIMDTYIDAADPAIGTDLTVNVKFNYNGSTNSIDCVKIYQSELPGSELVGLSSSDMQSVGIVKKK